MAFTADKYLSFPIASITKAADDDLIVWGRASDGTLDHDLQICDPGWSSRAIKAWAATGGNVRLQHRADSPVGKGISAETDADGATWVRSIIVEPLCQRMLRKGVLTAYSVGITYPKIKRDPTGRAQGGIIYDGVISELSLVDRGSNPNCGITIGKTVGGRAVYVGEAWGTVPKSKNKQAEAEKLLRKAAKLLDVEWSDPGPDPVGISKSQLLAIGKAAAREVARREIVTWNLNSGDPFTREAARSHGLHF